MSQIRITKIFQLEIAHALLNHDGPCKNIHGHSYRLHVTVTGRILNKANHPKDGMIIDFKDLKKIIKKAITDEFDHALVLNNKVLQIDKHHIETLSNNIIYVPYQPTCENIIIDFVKRIQKQLPINISLHSLKLFETSTSYAEWYLSDN